MKFNFLLKLFICLIFILSFSFFLNLSKVQAAGPSDIVINEVEYDSLCRLNSDVAGEWFELYNNADISVTLLGWKITDNQGTDTIPDLTIDPHGFAIVAATFSGFTEIYDPTGLNIVYLNDGRIGNGLSNAGDILTLKNDTQEVDKISYGTNINGLNPSIPGVNEGHSLERCPWGQDTNSASDFIDQDSPTPGQGILPNQSPVAEAGPNQNITLGQTVNFDASNSYDTDGQVVSYYWDFGDGEDCNQACPSHIYNEVGQFTATLTVTDDNGVTSSDQAIINVSWPVYSSNVILNELLPNPKDNETTDEYIEIFNRGTAAIDLEGWKLSDKSGSYYIISKKDFPSTIIPAHGYFVLYREITGISLNNSGGEQISFYSPNGNQKDSVSYSGSAQEDCSYNRTDNGWQWSATLTPGAGNIITAAEPDSSNKVSSIKKAKTTKSSSTKASGTGSGSVLGIKKAQAAGNPSSHHFSDNVMPDSLSSSGRWSILVWLIMITSFLSLVIFRFILWRKERY